MDIAVVAEPTPYRSRRDDWLDAVLARFASPTQRDRAALLFIAAHVALWTIYSVVSRSSQDVHFDMGEAVVWSHERWLNTPKHPPLSAWIPGVWFSVLPRQDWAYYLLAILGSGVGLWCAWQISKRYLNHDKLAVALVMLSFVPFYNFHALKYNANTVMIPVWGLATWTYVRSFQSRSLGWATLAGLAGAAVLLAKYWGIFLLTGFATAAILDPRRSEYFRSPAPWISIAVGVCALLPHFASVGLNDFQSFSYALRSHSSAWYMSTLHAPRYLASVTGYLILPIAITAFASGANWAILSDVIFPQDPDRRFCLVIFFVPVFVPLLIAPLASSDLNALWIMGGLSLFPTILFSSPMLDLSRQAARRVMIAAILFPIVLLAASPLLAIAGHLKRRDITPAQYQLLAKEIEDRWRALSANRLTMIGGNSQMINGVAFYLTSVPSTFDVDMPSNTPWATNARVDRDGIVVICEIEDSSCIRNTSARLDPKSAKTVEIIGLNRVYFGIEGRLQKYLVSIYLPFS